MRDDVTDLLDKWSQGDPRALDGLMEAVHDELRTVAGRFFQQERREHTLQPTALVHELYVKLAGQRQVNWHGRAEFFAVAARNMRNILVDHARKHRRQKRGGGSDGTAPVRVSLENVPELALEKPPDVVALDDALIDLERLHPRQARIVEMRLLAGLKLEEIAAVLDVSRSTVAREWRTARLFLLRQLENSP